MKEDVKKISEKKEKIETKNKKSNPVNYNSEVVWTQKMSVHEENIDKQHQSLLKELNKIINEISTSEEIDLIRASIHFCDNYLKEHFSYEENYMKRINFPYFKQHKKQHEGFIEYYNKFKKNFDKIYSVKSVKREDLKKLIEGIREFLGTWFVNHIKVEDQKYAQFAAKNPPKLTKEEQGKKKPAEFDMASIKSEIEQQLKSGKIKPNEAQILEQRAPVKHISELRLKEKTKRGGKEYVETGIPGFDELFESGIPKGNSIIIAGGAGSGKTILCMQILINKANEGKKCFYMSFEESESKLKQHMKDFGWDAEKLINSDRLRIQRTSPFDITRSVDALLAKEKGELLIDIDPVLLPKDFKPDFIVVDSLTAIASAFTGKEDSYRIYIEQLFRFFEKIKATTFLVTETAQIPEVFSATGVEEFLADGVIVLYNIKRGNIRESAIEILKMRGEKHQKKIVAMQITNDGIVVYPEQEVFGGLGEE